MKKKLKYFGMTTMLVALALGGCKAQDKGNVEQKNAAVDAMVREMDGAQSMIEQYGLDIMPVVQVEAGTECLTPEMFFENYNNQTLAIETELTMDELSVTGQVYPVNVVYDNHNLTIDVEVIDTIAPTIEKVENIVVKAGNTIAYKKAVATSDNSSNSLDLQIDNSAVDTQTPGIYNVVYTVTDAAGNSASTEVELTVVEATSHTEEDVKELAEKVIASVVPEGATPYEAAKALFQYVQWNVTYLHTSGDRSSVWAGAYEGLHDHAGDCYTFYATYAVLLTYYGIDNECVARIGGETNHWWNLVNVGEGWYHCDSSPRRYGDGYYCFMQTDDQIAAYTQAYPEKPNYYTFDDSLLPERETEIIFGYEPETIVAKYCTDAVSKRIAELKNSSETTTTVTDIPEETTPAVSEEPEQKDEKKETKKDKEEKKDTKKDTKKNNNKKDKKSEAAATPDATDDEAVVEEPMQENASAEAAVSEVPVEGVTVPEEAGVGETLDMLEVAPEASITE